MRKPHRMSLNHHTNQWNICTLSLITFIFILLICIYWIIDKCWCHHTPNGLKILKTRKRAIAQSYIWLLKVKCIYCTVDDLLYFKWKNNESIWKSRFYVRDLNSFISPEDIQVHNNGFIMVRWVNQGHTQSYTKVQITKIYIMFFISQVMYFN